MTNPEQGTSDELLADEVVLRDDAKAIGRLIAEAIFRANKTEDRILRLDEAGLAKVCAFAVQTALHAADVI